MSTKNISRTIIEGGRHRRNKYDRYQSNATERAELRAFRHSAEYGDEDTVLDLAAPKREPVYQGFDDKLAAVYRWLRSHVGQPWDVVFSKLCSTFDTRTTAGRHITHDHVLRSITHEARPQPWGFRYNDFVVGLDGVLREGERSRWAKRRAARGPSDMDVRRWARDRRVMDYGVSVFWMVPEKVEWRECHHHSRWDASCYREHREGVRPTVVPEASVTERRYPRTLLRRVVKDDGTVVTGRSSSASSRSAPTTRARASTRRTSPCGAA